MMNRKHEIAEEEDWLDELLVQMNWKELKTTEFQGSSDFTNNQIL